MFPTLFEKLLQITLKTMQEARSSKSIHTFASSMSKTSHQGDLTPLIARSKEQVKKATWIKSEKKKKE